MLKKDFFDYFSENHKNIGIIANFFTKQFLEKEFNVLQIPVLNFKEYLEINNITAVLMDNDIYETDHIWFQKERSGIIAYLKLNNIEISVIKNSSKNIMNNFLDYPIIEIDVNDEKDNINSNTHLPVILNEDRFNAIKPIKKLDVLYLKKDKLIRTELIQQFHSSLNPVKEEIVYTEISKKMLLDLFEKIKQSKCLYIYEPEKMDPVLLKYIELASILQNTIVLYSNNNLWSNFALVNEEAVNINYMAIMKEDDHYTDKILLPLQRKAFLKHTFVHYNSLASLYAKNEEDSINIEISVITSTNRKSNLDSYIKQMNKQNFVDLQVILVTHGFELEQYEKDKIYDTLKFDLEIIEVSAHMPLGYCLNTAISRVKHPYIAKMDDDDFYFENYLIDSWIAAKYSGADLVGKLSTYTFLEGSKLIISKHKKTRRKYNEFVMGATFFSKSSLMKKYMFSYLSTGEDSDFLRRINEDNSVIYADHPYNFCIYRSNNLDSHTWKISDINFMKNSTIESYDHPTNFLSF